MKLALLALAFAVVPAAFATSVTFNTGDAELCLGGPGCGVQTQVIGSVTVTYNPAPSLTYDPKALGGDFTFANFGSIVLSCTGGGTGCGNQTLDGLTLYIVIDQTSPIVGSGGIPGGSITGAFLGNASSAQITWPSPAAVDLSGFVYSVRDNPLALVPPTTNNGAPGAFQGVTTIQGKITETAVPEPSTYMLFSAGLLALGLRRKYAKR
jgi:hypothetical protein